MNRNNNFGRFWKQIVDDTLKDNTKIRNYEILSLDSTTDNTIRHK